MVVTLFQYSQNMGDDDCLVFARLGVNDGQLGAAVQADQDAAFSLAKTAAEELKYDHHSHLVTSYYICI